MCKNQGKSIECKVNSFRNIASISYNDTAPSKKQTLIALCRLESDRDNAFVMTLAMTENTSLR